MAYGITNDGLYQTGSTMDAVNNLSWGKDAQSYDAMKSAGAGISISTTGAANAIYGPMLHLLPYMKHNTMAVLGEKPYKTGQRFQVSLSLGKGDSTGIVRGGYPTAATLGTYAQVEMPYKLSAIRRLMTLGAKEIGDKNIDDITTWEQFFKAEGETWMWSQNNDLLRRIEDAPIVGNGNAPIGVTGTTQTGERVGFESIDRIISNGTEATFLPNGYAVPWVADPAYAGSNSQMATYRDPSASGFVQSSSFDCYVDSNYTSGTTSGAATLRPLTIDMLDSMFMGVMPYWENNRSSGKTVITRYDTIQKIQGLVNPLQRFIGSEFVQTGVNGVSTVEGRGAGFQVSTYNGVPLVPDLQVNGGTAADADSGVGRIYMTNQDALYMGVLRQPMITVSDNSIVNNQYVRLADFNKLGETQVSGSMSFKGLGKIIHLS